EAFQSYTINVDRNGPQARSVVSEKSSPPGSAKSKSGASKSGGAKSAPQPNTQQKSAPDMKRSEIVSAEGDPVPIDSHRLELPSGDFQITPGFSARTLLVLHGDRLTILGADGIGIQKSWQLPKRYLRIAERADHWVAITEKPYALETLRKET